VGRFQINRRFIPEKRRMFMSSTAASTTYPLTQPKGYNLATAQTCIALVNVAIDMVKQWEQITDPPGNWKWFPRDVCKMACPYPLDYLTIVNPLSNADILNTTFGTVIGRVDHKMDAKNEPFGFIATSTDGRSAYLIFHGSVTKADWAADFMAELRPYTAPDGTSQGKVETGFHTVFNSIANLKDRLQALKVTNLYVSGHSLGAAVATLCLPAALEWVPNLKRENVYCYLTGSPKVGDRDFAHYIESHYIENGLGIKFFRTVNLDDPVPKLPLRPEYVAIAKQNEASFNPPSYGKHNDSPNNHNPCCSYAYALFNPANTQNLSFGGCDNFVPPPMT